MNDVMQVGGDIVKLIICTHCRDIVKLTRIRRYCFCGRAYGQYLSDGVQAEIAGEAVPIGFANHSFQFALDNRPDEGAGFVFEAFVIPVRCDTVTKL